MLVGSSRCLRLSSERSRQPEHWHSKVHKLGKKEGARVVQKNCISSIMQNA